MAALNCLNHYCRLDAMARFSFGKIENVKDFKNIFVAKHVLYCASAITDKTLEKMIKPFVLRAM